MRASITVSRISLCLLIAAALSLCPAPSAAAPTMQWDGDQTVTGNHVTLGNAGVGTSAPSTTLHVYKDVDLTSFTGATLGQGVIAQKPTTNRWATLDFNTSGTHTSKPLARIGMKYGPSGSSLAFGTSDNYANGVTNQAMTIDSAGRVGIGKANPSYSLDIGNSTGIRMTAADASNVIWYSPSSRNFYFGVSSCNNYTTTFDNASTGRHDVSVDGYVGIGTASPSAALDVAGNTELNGYVYNYGAPNGIAFQKSTGSRFWIDDDEAAGALVFSAGSSPGSGTDNILSIRSNGKVGIGTASPTYSLDIANSTGIRMTAADASNVFWYSPSQRNFYFGTSSSANYTTTFDNASTGRHDVVVDGYAGIGISSPAARFHAVGCAHYDNANVDTGYAAIIRNNVNVCQNCSNQQAHWGLKIQAGSNNGGGTTHAIGFYDNADVFRGSILVTSGSIELSTQSDARLKRDIVDTRRDGLAMVQRVPVRDFTFIDNGSSHTGFIAQELEPVYPETVQNVTYARIVEHHNPVTIPTGTLYEGVLTTTPLEVDEITTESVQETVKTIAPMMLIPILWKAVQQQQTEKEALETKCAEAEIRLAALEKAVGISGGAGAPAPGGSVVSGGSVVGGASTASTLSSTSTLSDETIRRLTESVLAKLGVDPWVEITAAEAWEEVDETAPVSAVETVTRYRFNPETRAAEAYTVLETVNRQEFTGCRTVQLKKDVRLDEKTGKFYRWCGLGGTANGTTVNGTANVATPAQTAAALSKLSPQSSALSPLFSVLQPPVSGLKTQSSALSPQSSVGR